MFRQQQVGLSLHDDLLPSTSSSPATTANAPADDIGGGVRRLSLLGNEPTMTSDSEGDGEDNGASNASDFDLSEDGFEAVDADDIDDELLEQEIAKELEEDDDL